MSKGNGIFVEVQNKNGDEDSSKAFEKAMKKFKKKIKLFNLMTEIFDRQFYEKPSVVKRRNKRKAITRNKYRLLEMKEKER